MAVENIFNVPVFFIIWRETMEAGIILSVLLAFIKQTIADIPMRKRLYKQIWFGALAGFGICLVVGGAFIGVFYRFQNDIWGAAEDIWEGTFSIVASILITIMGLAILRISSLQEKWRGKLAIAMQKGADGSRLTMGQRTRKYFMAILPFITVLREGLEAVVFVGGVSIGQPATSFPLPVVCGLLSGVLISVFIYYGGNILKLKYFLIASTCLMYLIGAGLFSKAVWNFEMHEWTNLTGGDAAETGSGPGSYDIRQSVWHVNGANPELTTDGSAGGWGIFNSILGWTNSATIGSVVSYCIYWLAITLTLIYMRVDERRQEQGKRSILTVLLRRRIKPQITYDRVNSDESKSKASPDVPNLTNTSTTAL